MPTLLITNFNIVCATIGGFVSLFGLVSYLLKERFHLSEALISLLVGITFSHGTKFLKPLEYAFNDEENLRAITLYFARLVLGVQLVLAGIQLPSKYLLREWKSLALLLGPGMTVMWVSSSLLIWGLVPNLSFLHALAMGACVTPTDPVLSNSIVKGRFADQNIPKDLQNLIIAESGANDGLGYPFLFFALYIIKYVNDGGAGQPGGARLAMGYWFGETWGYTILLSVVYGAAVGWLAKELLHFAEEKNYVDRESFLVFAISLALFITGTCGLIGSDDVLACFIAGNSFTYDDWFRKETQDDSLQPTIDMLLNLSIFMWFGAVCPWYSFVHNDIIPIYRLIPLGILILLFRRIPVVTAMHSKIWQIGGDQKKQALFVGFFGPIGVSAVFYLYLSLDFLKQVTVDGEVREDAARLEEVFMVVVWFLAICSIIVHGLSIPLGKLGYHLPRTISSRVMSNATSQEGDQEMGSNLPFRVNDRELSASQIVPDSGAQRRLQPATKTRDKKGSTQSMERARTMPPRAIFKIGGTVIKPPQSGPTSPRLSQDEKSRDGGLFDSKTTSDDADAITRSNGEDDSSNTADEKAEGENSTSGHAGHVVFGGEYGRRNRLSMQTRSHSDSDLKKLDKT